MADLQTSYRTVRDSLSLVSTQLIVSLFSLCYFTLIARLFSKLDMSVLAVVGILNAIGGSVGGLGLMTLALQRVPNLRSSQSNDEAARMLGSCVTYSVLGTGLILLPIAAASKLLSAVFFKTPDEPELIMAACALLLSYKAYESANLLAQALDDFRTVARMRLVNDVCLRILALPGYIVAGIKLYLVIVALGQLFTATFVLVLKRDQIAGWRFLDWRFARRLIYEARSFYGMNMVRSGASQADSLLVGILLRPDALATYYIIRRFHDYLGLFYDVMLAPLIPKVAERRERKGSSVADAFRRSSRYFLPLCLLTPVILIALSPVILAVFSGPKYMSGLAGMRILLVAAALYGLYSFHSSFILGAARPRDSLINDSVAGLCNVGFSTWMTMAYGVTGGAGARAVAMAVATLTSFWILSRRMLVKLGHDWELLKCLLPVTLAGACAITLMQLWVQNAIAVGVGCGSILLISACWSLRTANPQDVEFLMNSLQLKRWSIARRVVWLLRPSS